MRLSTKRRMISLGYFIISNGLLILVMLAISSSGADTDIGIGLLILVNHLLIFWLPGYRRLIQRLFLATERCYNCGLVIDLTGAWRCECGFSRFQHILARCPGCKTYIDEFQCPQCEVTIRV